MTIFEEMGLLVPKDKGEFLEEQLLYNITEAFNLLNREASKLYHEFNLTPAKINVLIILERINKEEGLKQNQISKKLIVTKSNITGLIDRLEKDSLVERTYTKDRRIKLVKITKKGSQLLENVWPKHIEKTKKMLSCLNKHQLQQAVDILTKLRQYLKTKKQ